MFDNPFCGAKIPKFDVKIVVLGAEDVKSQQTSPNIWKVNAQKEQIAAAILYCHVLLLKTQQPTTWNTLMGTQSQPSPWPNMTKFHPDPDAVKIFKLFK